MQQHIWIGVTIAALMAACSSNKQQQELPDWGSVSGTVTAGEQIVPPPDAEMVVRLEDVSKMDVAAERIGETRFALRSAPPWKFTIKYEPALIQAGRRYALRAGIYRGNQLLYTSTDHVPAFSADAPEIRIYPVGGSSANTVIEGRKWLLAGMPGASLEAITRIPSLTLDPALSQAAGFAGCNRYFGGYEKKDNALTFGPIGATRMACVEGMEIEDRFLKMLEQVRSWKLQGQQLLLLDEAGATLASFS